MTDIASDEAGKENLTGLMNPGPITEHGDQHTESSEEKSSVKISKTLNSEYMRNRKMIESAERNVKYVIFQKVCKKKLIPLLVMFKQCTIFLKVFLSKLPIQIRFGRNYAATCSLPYEF